MKNSVHIRDDLFFRLKSIIKPNTGGVRGNVNRILEGYIKREEKKLGIEDNARKYEGQ